MRKISVGDRFWRDLPSGEGARYYYEPPNAHMLELYLEVLSEADTRKIVKGVMEVGVVSGPDALLFGARFAHSFWFMAPYSLHLVPESERDVPSLSPIEPPLLKVLLIELRSGIIKGLRQIQLREVFFVHLHRAIRSQIPAGGGTKEHYLKAQYAMMDSYGTVQQLFEDGFRQLLRGYAG